MTWPVSTNLTTEMNSLIRTPASQVTVEQFLPEWTEQIGGLAGLYAHGHGAAVALNGSDTGEDVLFRARAGSSTNPQSGLLYVAAIRGDNLDTPADWESLWVSGGATDLVDPAWSADSGAAYGAALAVVHYADLPGFRVFYITQEGGLNYADFDYSANLLTSGQITTLTVDASLQIAACTPTELFLLRTELVEAGYAAWHKPVYGSMLYRYHHNGSSWVVDDSFPFHTHAEAHLLKDDGDYDAATTGLIAQWGHRPCGGLAANEIDSNTVCVTFGVTHWRRWGYSTNSQGLQSYLYYRDGGVWRKNFESGVADWSEDLPRISYDVFARGSSIEGNQVLVWSRNDEPMDRAQLEGDEIIPRLREVVYAKIDPTGRYLTQFQRLGPQPDLTAATIVAVNHAGSKRLYALGWQAVYDSPAASFLCEVPESQRQALDLHATGYTTGRDNNWGMDASITLKDASLLFNSGTVVREGNLVRLYHGNYRDKFYAALGRDGYHVRTTSSYPGLTMGYSSGGYGAGARHGVLRYASLDAPVGATILSATFQIKGNSTLRTDVTVEIRADADFDAPLYVNDEATLLARPMMAAAILWTLPWPWTGVVVTSPDITALVQEFIDQPGYTPGGPFQLYLLNTPGNTATRSGQTYGVTYYLSLTWQNPDGSIGITDLAQIGQGYLDLSDPTISLQQRQHAGRLVARADKLLLDTRAESFEDVLPQNTRYLPPDNPIKYIARHNGYWSVEEARWPDLFFPGAYPKLAGKEMYQLGSSMEAFTGGGDAAPGVYGGGGKVWEVEPSRKGSFYSDVVWLAHDPAIDGAVQATVRMGDNLNYADFEGTAASGCPVSVEIIRENGHIRRIDYSTHDCPDAPDGVWNRVAQEATMAGLICRAIQIGKKYAFVWEANSDFDNSSHLEDQAGRYWNSLVFDAPDFGNSTYPPDLSGTKGANRLYLLISDYDEDDPDWAETTQADRAANPNWQDEQLWLHRYVAGGIAAQGLTVGRPADLKMQVLGGTIHCFYRPYAESPKWPWRHAFSHNAGFHSAGKFGLVGRGHSTIYWDVLWSLRDHLTKTRNVVDFCDIHMTDGVEDRTMEEVLRGYAWEGLTETEFRSFVNEASLTVAAGELYSGFYAPPGYSQPAKIENLTINFDLRIEDSGGEAGVYLKATSSTDPKQDCVYIGLTANTGYKNADNSLNCQAVYRRWQNGVELTGERDYSPSALHLKPGQTYPVRITVRDRLYSIWVAGNYIGHFGKVRESEEELKDARAEYCYFGLYALNSSATFENIYVPELFEIPTYALLDVNQAMKEAMTKVIGKRMIKGVFRPNGKLLLSYFDWHDAGPAFQNNLTQNQHQETDRFTSVCHVEGAYTYAVYASPVLLPRGRRFLQYHNPDLMLPEHCYREAKAIVKASAENMEQANFAGLPDIRLEPEDQDRIVVTQQAIDGDWLVNSVEFTFDMAERKSFMKVSTRKVFEIDNQEEEEEPSQ